MTWTRFTNPTGAPGFITDSKIVMSYSDDMGRSWSPQQVINGGAPFCTGSFAGGTACDDNQFSVPTVNPHTGHLYVAFENFDTPDENQVLVVRSIDGGANFAGPFFVTPMFDVNLRLRAECASRGANRVHLTNTCFRIPNTLAIVADRRDGAFADDLYLVMFDNRNGTRDNTNTDVQFFKSINGGGTWIGPTRVNDDPSTQPANRNCGRSGQPACPPAAGSATGNDQFWPWVDINDRGDLNVGFHDRRLDADSVASEWPTSRVRPGNYLVWYWGGGCSVNASNATACVAPTAAAIPQPAAPVNPGNELFPDSDGVPVRQLHRLGRAVELRLLVQSGPLRRATTRRWQSPIERSTVWGLFTDARNGRSSRTQSGRNPACEQSDVFLDSGTPRVADPRPMRRARTTVPGHAVPDRHPGLSGSRRRMKGPPRRRPFQFGVQSPGSRRRGFQCWPLARAREEPVSRRSERLFASPQGTPAPSAPRSRCPTVRTSP